MSATFISKVHHDRSLVGIVENADAEYKCGATIHEDSDLGQMSEVDKDAIIILTYPTNNLSVTKDCNYCKRPNLRNAQKCRFEALR